jgi:hypothetical protein
LTVEHPERRVRRSALPESLLKIEGAPEGKIEVVFPGGDAPPGEIRGPFNLESDPTGDLHLEAETSDHRHLVETTGRRKSTLIGSGRITVELTHSEPKIRTDSRALGKEVVEEVQAVNPVPVVEVLDIRYELVRIGVLIGKLNLAVLGEIIAEASVPTVGGVVASAVVGAFRIRIPDGGLENPRFCRNNDRASEQYSQNEDSHPSPFLRV